MHRVSTSDLSLHRLVFAVWDRAKQDEWLGFMLVNCMEKMDVDWIQDVNETDWKTLKNPEWQMPIKIIGGRWMVIAMLNSVFNWNLKAKATHTGCHIYEFTDNATAINYFSHWVNLKTPLKKPSIYNRYCSVAYLHWLIMLTENNFHLSFKMCLVLIAACIITSFWWTGLFIMAQGWKHRVTPWEVNFSLLKHRFVGQHNSSRHIV